MSFRAFVGVPLEPVAPALSSLLDGLAACGADLKVVDADHLHLTLSFLGDTPDDAEGALASALDEATRGQTAFTIELAGVGAFPNARHPRVVWAGIREPKRIVDLALRARECLAAAGFRGDDKDFRAHVTLARIRSDRDLARVVAFLREHGRDELQLAVVDRIVLFKSVLGPRGPSYHRLHEAKLEAASA